jgi:hypothetical protein
MFRSAPVGQTRAVFSWSRPVVETDHTVATSSLVEQIKSGAGLARKSLASHLPPGSRRPFGPLPDVGVSPGRLRIDRRRWPPSPRTPWSRTCVSRRGTCRMAARGRSRKRAPLRLGRPIKTAVLVPRVPRMVPGREDSSAHSNWMARDRLDDGGLRDRWLVFSWRY